MCRKRLVGLFLALEKDCSHMQQISHLPRMDAF